MRAQPRHRHEVDLAVAEVMRELRLREETGRPSESLAGLSKLELWERALESTTYITPDSVIKDLWEVMDAAVKDAAARVVAVVPKTMIAHQGNGLWKLLLNDAHTLASQNQPWCANVPFGSFGDQLMVPKGTASLAASDLVLTAAHVTAEGGPEEFKFVFDLEMIDGTTCRSSFTDDQVFDGTVYDSGGDNPVEAWQIIRLDRPVPNRQPLRWRHSGMVPDGTEVMGLSFAAHLPMKYIVGGKVVDNSSSRIFGASLGGFDGSSGSPVFSLDREGLMVEGILVAAAVRDFFNANGCYQALEAPDGTAVSVLRITEVPAP